MKCQTALRRLVVIFAGALMLSVAAEGQEEQPGCSAQSAAGKWSFTDSGTVIGLGPRTAVGIFTLDGDGHLLNGMAWSSLNGNFTDERFSGTYTVASDCTGTITVNIFDKKSGNEIFAVLLNTAFDSKMKELRGIFNSVTAPNGSQLSTVINLEARRQ